MFTFLSFVVNEFKSLNHGGHPFGSTQGGLRFHKESKAITLTRIFFQEYFLRRQVSTGKQ
jgi:hypothetical protein